MIKTKFVLLLVCSFSLLSLSAFKNPSPAQDYRIVVGIAYKDMNCNGLTVKTAQGYEWKTARGGNMGDMMDGVKNNVADNYNIRPADVVIKTGYQPYAVIIRYSKYISGWGCNKTIYTVGFGKSETEAENNAIRNKESNSAHTVVRTLSI